MATRIQEAQEAILVHANGKKFSHNVVCIEIVSSDCQDLSLIDLPDLIESSESQVDKIYVELILSLVRDYLAPSNTSTLVGWCSRLVFNGPGRCFTKFVALYSHPPPNHGS